MEEKTPSTKKNHIGRDLIGALIVVTASAASVVMPLFFFISVLVCCALLCGGRRNFSLLLLAASFAVQAFLTGSFFMASLFMMAAAIMMAPVKVFHLKFSDRPHFDGILAACAGVAVMIGAVYGMLYLALGGEPIHLVCEAMQQSFVEETTGLGTEMLRTIWQTQQVVFSAQGQSQMSFESLMHISEQSMALSHAELAKQTEGFLEVMTRMSLPALCVVLVSIGGLLLYVLPTRWMHYQYRGIGKRLGLNEAARRLPAFADWKLPRDIGGYLIAATLLLVIASFMGLSAIDGAMSLVYTLYTAVFYVQGLSVVAFMTRRWKWPTAARVVFILGMAALVQPMWMIGSIDYLIRLREFMDFSKQFKEAAQTGDTEKLKHIWPGISIHTVDLKKNAQNTEEENASKTDTNNTDTTDSTGAEDAHDDKEE